MNRHIRRSLHADVRRYSSTRSKERAQGCECKNSNPKHPRTDARRQKMMDDHGVPVLLLRGPDRKSFPEAVPSYARPVGNACPIV